MRSLADTDAGQLGNNVNEVSEALSKFSKNVAALNATYEVQLQTTRESLENVNQFYGNLEELLKNIVDASADTKKYKEEMNALANNLAALNTIYGNMLNAMSYKHVNQY
jgi:gliding motility-associated protein GldL